MLLQQASGAGDLRLPLVAHRISAQPLGNLIDDTSFGRFGDNEIHF
jgi:hypothetical protein